MEVTARNVATKNEEVTKNEELKGNEEVIETDVIVTETVAIATVNEEEVDPPGKEKKETGWLTCFVKCQKKYQ